jgi:hypothetical protein
MTERRRELTAAVLLALATVATAWAAYQARQWTGEQSQGYSRATAARIEGDRAAAFANRQVQIDVATFIAWIDARAQDRTALARFYRARFRPEFRPAFAAWLATRPLQDGAAAATPFALPQYRLASTRRAQRLEATAAAASDGAKDANERADNYMLAVVLCASSLAFAGFTIKVGASAAASMVLGLGCLFLLAALVWITTLPVHLST